MKPKRFYFSEDVAKGMMKVVKRFRSPINLGSGKAKAEKNIRINCN